MVSPNIHLAVANHDVAIGAKALSLSLVLVDVLVINIDEVALANCKVNHRYLPTAINLIGIASEISRIARPTT